MEISNITVKHVETDYPTVLMNARTKLHKTEVSLRLLTQAVTIISICYHFDFNGLITEQWESLPRNWVTLNIAGLLTI